MAGEAIATADEIRRFNAQLEPDFRRVEATIRAQVAPRVAPPQVLFHYTGMPGFRGIVETQRMWATDIRYLNDAEELSYSNRLFASIIDGRISEAKDAGERELLARLARTFDFREMLIPFVAAFSEIDDDLSQWRGYAQGVGGVALGLDLRRLPDALQAAKIEYDEDVQKGAIRTLIGNVIALYRELTPKHAAPLQTFLMARC